MMHINMEDLEELIDWPPGKHPHQKRSPEKWRERLRKAEEELRNLPEGKTRSNIFTTYRGRFVTPNKLIVDRYLAE